MAIVEVRQRGVFFVIVDDQQRSGVWLYLKFGRGVFLAIGNVGERSS